MQIVTGEERVGPLLSRSDAEGFVEIAGDRAAFLGQGQRAGQRADQGHYEVWIWPLLVLEGVELVARDSATDELLPLGPRTVRVVPEGLALEWPVGEGRVLLEGFPVERERGLVLLLSYDGAGSLNLELHLRPAFRPMWPAGIGGQVSGIDEETGALYLSEERGRFGALIGAPGGTVQTGPNDRGLVDHATVQVSLAGNAGEGGVMPVLIVGSAPEPRPLTEDDRRGGSQSAKGLSRAEGAIAAARELFRRLEESWRGELEGTRARWSNYLRDTAHFTCSDDSLERAFLWSKIAIERAWVESDDLGRSLVAGLGPAHGGDRPGYGWFFSGDAFSASRALSWTGDHDGCRAAFRWAARHQSSAGKIPHEVSLSAKLCDWFEEYPYAFYKGQTTPGFVSCLGHYVDASGDTQLAEELWDHVVHALEWCVGVCDANGYMRVEKAGIAAVEAGPLAGVVGAEAFLQGIWVSAYRAGHALARRIGKERPGCLGNVPDPAPALAVLLDAGEDHAAFGLSRDGDALTVRSAYAGLGLSRLPGARGDHALQQNHPQLMTDWGARMFSSESEHYAPDDYNTGSVFPYLTGFSVLALFQEGHAEAGMQVLRGMAALDGFDGLGYMPEFLAGDAARSLERGVAHQVFSHSAFLQGILQGLCGLTCVGEDDLGIHLSPAGLEQFGLTGLRFRGRRLDVRFEDVATEQGRRWTVKLSKHAGADLDCHVRLNLPPCTRVKLVSDGMLELCAPRQASVLVKNVCAQETIEFEIELGPSLVFPATPVMRNAPSRHPRLVRCEETESGGTWEIHGPAGQTVRVPYACDIPVTWSGAEVVDGALSISFPECESAGSPTSPLFVPATIRFQLAEPNAL